MGIRSLVVALALAVPVAARAELGGPSSSVGKEAEELGATLERRHQDQQLTWPGGTIHQYADDTGTIYAVTWRGRAAPNLERLLGPHFARFVEASKPSARSHRVFKVELPDLVVRSAVHGRLHQGRAFLPKAVPADVSVEELP